jgi:probable F420-dependent oxidoreductase
VRDRESGTAGWREALGRVGVWVNPVAIEGDLGGFADRVEQLGYGGLWVGGGNPDERAFELLQTALAKTSRIVVATGITNIWAWEPAALTRRVAALESAYPGRFLLGLGVSHAPLVEGLGRRYERPLEAMAGFLDGLDAADRRDAGGSSTSTPPRVLAALGKRMLELSSDRAAGAHPYLTPPEHTAQARQVLGAAPLLAPEQALVLESESRAARVTARAYLERYLRLPNYRTNLERLGYSEEDFAGQGSDRLTDALVPHGSAGEVAGRIRAHLEAGADHVCIQPLAHSGGIDAGALETLAPLLLAA